MEMVWTISYSLLRVTLRLALIVIIPITSICMGFDLASPTSSASLLSVLVACGSIAIALSVKLPEPPDFGDMSRGGGITPPGVPVESALRVPVQRKRKMPEPPLSPL